MFLERFCETSQCAASKSDQRILLEYSRQADIECDAAELYAI